MTIQMQTFSAPKKPSAVFKDFYKENYNFEQGVIPGGSQANSSPLFDVGTVIAQVSRGTVSVAAPVAAIGNTGNGACVLGSPAFDGEAQAGTYDAVAISPTEFEVFDPTGKMIGLAKAGVAFALQVHFTITAGGTDFSAGDSFAIAVTVALGTGKTVQLNPAATDGSEIAAGVIAMRVLADAAVDTPCSIATRGPIVLLDSGLVWPTGISVDAQTAALAQLALAGLVVRPSA